MKTEIPGGGGRRLYLTLHVPNRLRLEIIFPERWQMNFGLDVSYICLAIDFLYSSNVWEGRLFLSGCEFVR